LKERALQHHPSTITVPAFFPQGYRRREEKKKNLLDIFFGYLWDPLGTASPRQTFAPVKKTKNKTRKIGTILLSSNEEAVRFQFLTIECTE